MRLDLIWRTINDVDSTAISPPTLNAGRKMLVGIGDAPVVFVLKFVVLAIRIRVAPLPEGFNELVAFFVIRELGEGLALVISNDPAHIFVQPLLVFAFQLPLQ